MTAPRALFPRSCNRLRRKKAICLDLTGHCAFMQPEPGVLLLRRAEPSLR